MADDFSGEVINEAAEQEFAAGMRVINMDAPDGVAHVIGAYMSGQEALLLSSGTVIGRIVRVDPAYLHRVAVESITRDSA